MSAETPGQAPGIEVTHDPEIPVRFVQLWLCDLCLDGDGEQCHTPGCSLWLNRPPDMPIRNGAAVTVLDAAPAPRADGTPGRARPTREALETLILGWGEKAGQPDRDQPSAIAYTIAARDLRATIDEADAGRAAFLDEILLNVNDEPHVGEADEDFAIRYVRDLEHQAGELATLIAEGEPLTVKPADDVKPAPELAVTLAPGEEPGDNLTEDQRQRYRQWLAGQ